jgi:hypothetical protein
MDGHFTVAQPLGVLILSGGDSLSIAISDPQPARQSTEQEECGKQERGFEREEGSREGGREGEPEKEGEALEEISGGRKAEVFVDRGKQSSSGDKYRTALVVVVNYYQQGRML